MGDLNRSEFYRPQFHFTADEGFINDPVGLVYLNGVYHLYFQHNEPPDVCWGHATSTDLLHWTQHDDAIQPLNGHMAFSGSALIDFENASGLQSGVQAPIIAAFTSWGEGQCLAYSNDAGMTWSRFEHNPVLHLPGDELKTWELSARDPHLQWDGQRQQWLMVVYNNPQQRLDKKGAGFSFFSSTDLLNWNLVSHLPDFYVCPDIIELVIENEEEKTAWVAMDWRHYVVGEFNGLEFSPGSDRRALDYGKDLSANQTWKNLPDARVIQISWLMHPSERYPNSSFHQQLSLPVVLTLRHINDQLYLCKIPIEELKRLQVEEHCVSDIIVDDSNTLVIDHLKQSLDLEVTFSFDSNAEMLISILNTDIHITQNKIRCLGSEGILPDSIECQHVRIVVDVCSIEIFANNGLMSMSFSLEASVINQQSQSVILKALKGSFHVDTLALRELQRNQ